jgi:ergothioneine biosynthesis protein EgtB
MRTIYTLFMAPSLRTLQGQNLSDARIEAHTMTVSLFESLMTGLEHALGHVPKLESVNPPLWEFGHVAWFNEYWTMRNQHRARGVLASGGGHQTSDSGLVDGIFNSAVLAHSKRWDLPELTQGLITKGLEVSHEATLKALTQDTQAGLDPYFHRLSLAHELMHAEAFRMTGVNLGLALPGRQLTDLFNAPSISEGRLTVAAQSIYQEPDTRSFWFDNEGGRARFHVETCEIDLHPVTHGQYWGFVSEGGYEDARLWSEDGWVWRQTHNASGPKQLMHDGQHLRRQWQGEWVIIPEQTPMMLVCAHEAEAWCKWSGRRLPTEGEWLAGARAGIQWGRVWEWTSDPFLPFEGFSSHPYREYSAPWFGDHRVLKGCSWITNPLLKDARFRNFYKPYRTDVFAGFRSVKAV